MITDRIKEFLPSILILVSIVMVTFIYLKLLSSRWKDNLKSIEWLKKNQWKAVLLIGSPAVYILAPTLEELICRLPLIIIFSGISSNAWWGILVSSSFFALIHYSGNKITLQEAIQMKESGRAKSNDLRVVTEDIEKLQIRRIKIQRLVHVIVVFPLGILAGYYGIKYQSIWLSVGIHFAWNLIVPVILPIFVLWLIALFKGMMMIWDDKFGWRF